MASRVARGGAGAGGRARGGLAAQAIHAGDTASRGDRRVGVFAQKIYLNFPFFPFFLFALFPLFASCLLSLLARQTIRCLRMLPAKYTSDEGAYLLQVMLAEYRAREAYIRWAAPRE